MGDNSTPEATGSWSLAAEVAELERYEAAFSIGLRRAAVAARQAVVAALGEWDSIRASVAVGRTEEQHARRPELGAEIDARLDAVRRAAKLANAAGRLTEAVALGGAEAELTRFRVEILARWRTAEDLEDLVAEQFPLSQVDLSRIGAGARPPVWWYEEDRKPF